jgi:hypothetical protein
MQSAIFADPETQITITIVRQNTLLSLLQQALQPLLWCRVLLLLSDGLVHRIEDIIAELAAGRGDGGPSRRQVRVIIHHLRRHGFQIARVGYGEHGGYQLPLTDRPRRPQYLTTRKRAHLRLW